MGDRGVFLNHRGPDVKSNFLAHLDEALRAAGLNPFLDKVSLKKGDPAFRSIYIALLNAKVHVEIISKRYAESTYCLNELVAIMKSGKPVIPVFFDVEPGHLRRLDTGPFAAAFQKHYSREKQAQVATWTDALRKLADITGFLHRFSDYNGDEAKLKRDVVNVVMSHFPNIERIIPHNAEDYSIQQSKSNQQINNIEYLHIENFYQLNYGDNESRAIALPTIFNQSDTCTCNVCLKEERISRNYASLEFGKLSTGLSEAPLNSPAASSSRWRSPVVEEVEDPSSEEEDDDGEPAPTYGLKVGSSPGQNQMYPYSGRYGPNEDEGKGLGLTGLKLFLLTPPKNKR